MRKVAAQLGVTAMSLYNHVANKDALLDLMLDQVMSEVDSPDPGGAWRPMMRRRAHSFRAMLLHRSWAAPLLMSRIVLGEAFLRDGEACLACLVGAGFSYAQADWVRNTLDSHTYGYTVQELNYPVAAESYREAAAHYLPMIPRDTYPFTYGASKAIVDGEYDGKTSFDFGLDLILDGLERWAAGQG